MKNRNLIIAAVAFFLIAASCFISYDKMGPFHIIEKDGEREGVSSKINKYIGRWSWEK